MNRLCITQDSFCENKKKKKAFMNGVGILLFNIKLHSAKLYQLFSKLISILRLMNANLFDKS